MILLNARPCRPPRTLLAVCFTALLVAGCGASGGSSAATLRSDATPSPSETANADYPLVYASSLAIPLDHVGTYTYSTPSLPVADGLPGAAIVGGQVSGGSATVTLLHTVPQYTTSGSYLDVTFTVSSLNGTPSYVLSAAARLLPDDAATPSLTPSAASSS